MKPTVLKLALTTMLALSVATNAVATSGLSFADEPGHERGNKSASMMFAGLDLSAEQKQDIRQILRQSKQDNSVYQGEKKALRAQMQSLMQQSVWDEALATDLATQKATLGMPIELNKAKARNAAFAVLTAQQQSEFIAKQAERAERKAQIKTLNFERMQERLELSDEQVESLVQIQDAHLKNTAALRDAMKAHKDAERALIFSASFDESAWSALQTEIQPTLIALDVAKSANRFQMMQLLNDKQQAKLKRIMKKLQKGKGKSKGKARKTVDATS